MAGEPTLREQTRLFIEALNLGSPTAAVQPQQPITIARTNNIKYSMRTRVHSVNQTVLKVTPVSRRSIEAICDSPSEEICTALSKQSTTITGHCMYNVCNVMPYLLHLISQELVGVCQ